MRMLGRAAVSSVTIAALFIACGSRTGLLVDDTQTSSGPDATIDSSRDGAHADAPFDASFDVTPIREGGKLDANPDCPTPAYCDPSDPDHVYKCGQAIYECSSLEQCEAMGEEGASCVNPCVDTLGQDTSNGCEFYAVEMDTTPEVAGVCYAVFIVNQWKTGEPARIEVTRGAQTFDVTQFARIPVGKGTSITYAPYDAKAGLAKDQIAILFLSRDPSGADDPDPTAPRRLASCPPGVTPAIVGDAALHGTGRSTAFQIKTNVPVVAYQMLPYGAGRARVTGSTLLLPTNVWGDNYVAANAYPAPTQFSEDRAGPTMVVIGKENGTTVTIKPTQAIFAGGGLLGGGADTSISYTVNAGEYLQFTQQTELTGSAIQADKPVAVIGGSTLMDAPLDMTRADTAEQMLPPVRALSNEYVAVRYRSRDKNAEESVPWRIVGVVDGTQLTFDPPQMGAPTTINARQLVEFDASGPFVVSSQDAGHPFYFAQYMTGGFPYDGEGDPEFVNVIAPTQYLPRYTFFTDPTYPETNLVVTRTRDPLTAAMPDVSLECAGQLGGWTPIGSSGRYEFTRINLSTGDFVGQNGCDNGVHTIAASFANPGGQPPHVGVTVWGWGNPITWPPDSDPSVDEADPRQTRWVSYAYPAGANVTTQNAVILPAK